MTRAPFSAALSLSFALSAGVPASAETPRPEHPTPDMVRPHWANLNGTWAFRFDPKDSGVKEGWEKPGASGFDQTIVVPFPWESELSGVQRPDAHGVAWYRREFRVPDDFPRGQRVWLRFGAVDWRADVWVNGQHVANHEGGYTPFEADVTDALAPGRGGPNVLTVRVFDPTDPSVPTGKQVGWYTTTSGIWQTVWLEARPATFIGGLTVKTAIDPARVEFDVVTHGPAPAGEYRYVVRCDDPTFRARPASVTLGKDAPAGRGVTVRAEVEDARLWTPETPHLYDVTVEMTSPDGTTDTLRTYFGLRTIAHARFGDAPYERILLNGKPLYLRAALDQSFNPKGVYTAPTDEFLKQDMELTKSLGLNALRIHIKPDEPRRLYWADRLGVLVLEDMPNTWRQNRTARDAWERTTAETVARDRNHPSIVAWVAFNETWGLGTPPGYKKDRDTQEWVGRMVDRVRALDPTRLVEDNSPCNYDHVENTDLNSWHFYIDDHAAASAHVQGVVRQTEPGSGFNYCPGRVQGTSPLINSEYGGISAGGGDRDVSWSFRDLTTLLRRQPKIQGYVYTELSDIEWEHNGFVDYDRTPKAFGYDAFVPGMTPKDLNGADFVGYDGPPARVVAPGETVTVPVFVSHFSEVKGEPTLRWGTYGRDDRGRDVQAIPPVSRPARWTAYGVNALEPVTITAPDRPFVGAVRLELLDGRGNRVAANFVNLVVRPASPPPRAVRVDEHSAEFRFDPGDFARGRWSGGSARPAGKAYGRGKGAFEYRIRLPEAVVKASPESVAFRFEVASKAGREQVDWPERINPQDYPQTDARLWPSVMEVSVNGHPVARADLKDDTADARGVLSHLNRVDHGSYGALFEAECRLPDGARSDLAAGKPLVVRLAVPDDARHAGGLCLFGAGTGAYPFDPTVVIRTKDPLPSDLGVKPDAPVTTDRVADRSLVVLNAGDSGSPAEWSYTTTDPGPAWAATDFDASSWARGKAGFGTPGTPAVRVGTEWGTERIWLRTAVDMPRLGDGDALTLRLFHDEDAEVFVDGKPLLKARGFVSRYLEVELDAGQRALFHPGKNVIAVSCRQTRGGQGIDAGLVLQRGD